MSKPAVEFDDLPPRQKELARLIHQGMKRHEAAKAMKVSINTVRMYMGLIFSYLGIRSSHELILKVERSINKRVTDWKEKGLV